MSHIVKKTPGSKWQAIKEALSADLPKEKVRVFDALLENTYKSFVADKTFLMENASASAVSAGNIATLNKIILPMLRRVYPNVIAQELIGVQPAPGPVVQIASIRPTYGSTVASAGVMAGDPILTPLHVRDIAAAYSGNEIAGAAAGALTGQLEGVPGNAIKMEILKQLVEVKSRRLSARWTFEAETDANSMYGVNLQEELLGAVAQEITSEIDQEILRALRALPTTPTAFNTFNQGAINAVGTGATSMTGMPVTVVDQHAALANLVNYQANQIAARTRQGKGNWAVVSPTALTILESARASAFSRTTEGTWEAPTNNKYVGTLNNAIKLYVDQYADDDTPVLVGLKKSETEAATIYAPYVPLTMSDIVTDPNTGERVAFFSSRYAHVQFTNTATSLGNSADYLGLVGINGANLRFA